MLIKMCVAAPYTSLGTSLVSQTPGWEPLPLNVHLNLLLFISPTPLKDFPSTAESWLQSSHCRNTRSNFNIRKQCLVWTSAKNNDKNTKQQQVKESLLRWATEKPDGQWKQWKGEMREWRRVWVSWGKVPCVVDILTAAPPLLSVRQTWRPHQDDEEPVSCRNM